MDLIYVLDVIGIVFTVCEAFITVWLLLKVGDLEDDVEEMNERE